jgi:glycosyltransferase involved in cell wall biosynthesis
MRIAQIAPVWISVPPKSYGGTEEVVYELTEGLVRRGNDVTLFATGDSKTSAKLVSFERVGVLDQGMTFSDYLHPLYHLLSSLEHKKEFDILHFHFTTPFDFVALALVREFNNIVFTFHNPIPSLPPEYGHTFGKEFLEEIFPQVPIVSISNNQRNSMKLNFVETVYHGINIENFTFSPVVNPENMIYIGRISPIKGGALAIQSAEACRRMLIFAGDLESKTPRNVKYFEEEIKPRLNSSFVQSVGDLNFKEKIKSYLNSRLLIFPIQWEEPFGLVMIESMACGTPVVAFAKGSVPEVIKDGVTGFVINSSDEDIRGDFIIKNTGMKGLCEAIERVYSMPSEEYQKMRLDCRKHVEDNFTTDKMAQGYEKVYNKLLENK